MSISDGYLVKADHISKEAYRKISYIRNSKERVIMTYVPLESQSVSFKAQITMGVSYEGQRLKTKSQFVDVSLHADTSVLKEWFEGGRHDTTMVDR